MLKIAAILISLLLAVADSRGERGVAPLAWTFLSNTIFWSLLLCILRSLLLVEVLIIILVLILFWVTFLDMRGHRRQQSFLILSLLFLLVHIRISFLFLDHAHLLLPNRIRRLFEFCVYLFKFIATCSKATTSWIKREYPLELVARYVLLYQVVIEADALAMLLHRHPAHVAVLHRQSLLAFDDHVQLPTLLDAQLKDLKSILD